MVGTALHSLQELESILFMKEAELKELYALLNQAGSHISFHAFSFLFSGENPSDRVPLLHKLSCRQRLRIHHLATEGQECFTDLHRSSQEICTDWLKCRDSS